MLDGLRLVAAVGVMVFHFASVLPPIPGVWRVAPYGWLGGELFFLISGFVICMSAWGKPLSAFVHSRVVRLLPAYVFCVLATSAVLLIPGVYTPWGKPTISQVLTNLTMLQDGLGVAKIDRSYWTLWSELRFYLLFALIAYLGVTTRRVLGLCWGWTLAVILAPQAQLPVLNLVANPQYAPLFISGITVYLIRREGARRLQLWGLLGLNWLLMQHHMIMIVRSFSPHGHRLSWTVCILILSFFYGLMIAIALGVFDRITWRWLPTAGAIAYPPLPDSPGHRTGSHAPRARHAPRATPPRRNVRAHDQRRLGHPPLDRTAGQHTAPPRPASVVTFHCPAQERQLVQRQVPRGVRLDARHRSRVAEHARRRRGPLRARTGDPETSSCSAAFSATPRRRSPRCSGTNAASCTWGPAPRARAPTHRDRKKDCGHPLHRPGGHRRGMQPSDVPGLFLRVESGVESPAAATSAVPRRTR
ncbi:acyltransferase family protein [Streptomyces huasconensis]|uniref:acyltransferase family protein n=1 Tax=Streptomyces huasconensis TaxID=1854574 RepID=UPI0037022D5C